MSSKTWLLTLLGFALFWLPASQATAQLEKALCSINFEDGLEFDDGTIIAPKMLGADDLKFFADYDGGFTEIILLATVFPEKGRAVEYPYRIGVIVDKNTGVVLQHDPLERWGGLSEDDFRERFGLTPKVSCKVLAMK